MKRPLLECWKAWSWEDYLVYFLSYRAARARARRSDQSIARELCEKELLQFCEPIRAALARTFCGGSPTISIQLPCRNDQDELLATLVSYTLLDVEPGGAEIVVSDNASTDHTATILRACGIKNVLAPLPGMGQARRAAYDAMASSAEYVWLTDCDARAVPPIRHPRDLDRRSTILRTSIRAMNMESPVIGVSTGIVYEYTHPLFRMLRTLAVAANKAPRVHCWTGPNQFLRRSALDAIGGINPDVPYRAREDHQRMYELARYGKSIGAQLLSAATDSSLYDPVYHSGRRRGTLRDVLFAVARGRHVIRGPRDRFGYPIHPADRLK